MAKHASPAQGAERTERIERTSSIESGAAQGDAHPPRNATVANMTTDGVRADAQTGIAPNVGVMVAERAPLRLLTREDIQAVQDVKTKKVLIKAWNGYIYIRGMTAHERDEFEKSIVIQQSANGDGRDGRAERGAVRTLNDTTDIRAKYAIRVCVDEYNNPMFTNTDVDWLTNKSAAALDEIYSEGSELSGFTNKDVDELAKNSGAVRSGASS